MLQKHMKDSDQPLETEQEETALETTFHCLGNVADILNQSECGSIREYLPVKVDTFTEEDTGDQVEFIKTVELLQALQITDKSGLIIKLLG